MSTADAKNAALLMRLWTKTQSGFIDWNEDPFSNEVGASLGNYRVELSNGRNERGTAAEWIKIYNDRGELIDSFHDEDVTTENIFVPNMDSVFEVMKKLRTLAMRKARGADKAIDDILKQLEDDDDF